MIKSGASYIACHKENYIFKYDMLKPLKEGGTFIFNSKWTSLDLMEKNLPRAVKKALASKKLNFMQLMQPKLLKKLD